MKDSGELDFGKAKVVVDGEETVILDPHLNNRTHCNAKLIYSNKVTNLHRVEISMVEEDKDKVFTILGFGVV